MHLGSALGLIFLLLLCGSRTRAQAIFSGEWDVLAPFPRGFRELAADPLACWGGVLNVTRGVGYYPSELGTNGLITWQTMAGEGTLGPIDFSVWNNTLLEASNGWPAVAWQGWAITDIIVPSSDDVYALQCLYAPAFYVDNIRFHGDPLGYGIAPVLVYLSEGNHTLAVQLQNAVEYGGITALTIECSLFAPDADVIIIDQPNALVLPDLVEGRLASLLGSITIFNVGAPLTAVSVLTTNGSAPLSGPFVQPALASGQLMPVPFLLDPTAAALTGQVDLCVVAASFQGCLAYITLELANRTADEPFAFTFSDYDGSVQYAMLRLPPKQAAPYGPLIVALHGPTLDASSVEWTASIPLLPFTAVLYPSGRRPYGFEWHGPSALNALSAIKAVQLLPYPGLANTSVDFNRIVWVGHSAGAAGAWLMAARYPDRTAGLLAAAPFISLTQYISWTGHLGRAHRDGFLGGAVEASQAAQDGDLHAPNLFGLPLMIRYGADDELVSPWHARRLARLVQEQALNLSAVHLSEEPNAPHWFPTIFSGPVPTAFLTSVVNSPPPLTFPPLFSLIVVDPGSSGPRASLLVLQLAFPFRAGRMVVRIVSPQAWTATSENIVRWCLNADPRSANLTTMQMDGTQLSNLKRCTEEHYCLQGRVWTGCAPSDWSSAPRRPSQLGPSWRLYERPFAIVYAAEPNNDTARDEAEAEAVLIANDWYLHGGGNTSIYWHEDVPPSLTSSLVLLGHPTFNSHTAALLAATDVPLFYDNSTGFGIGNYGFGGAGLGLLALVPLEGAQLALIVSGIDDEGQRAALEALPFRPAQLSTDWLALSSPSFLCSGVGGVLGAGFWGNGWQFQPTDSYVRPSLPLPQPAQPQYALFALLVVLVAAAALILASAVAILWAVLPRFTGAAASAATSSNNASTAVIGGSAPSLLMVDDHDDDNDDQPRHHLHHHHHRSSGYSPIPATLPLAQPFGSDHDDDR